MPKGRPVTLEFLGEQMEWLLGLRDDMQVLATTTLRIDNIVDGLHDDLVREIGGLREEMSEIRALL
jgi:hypothetical protein